MTRFVTNKEAMAMSIADSRINNYTVEELKQYAYDRMVDELVDEPEVVLENYLLSMAKEGSSE